MLDYKTEMMFDLKSPSPEFLNNSQDIETLIIDLEPFLYMETINKKNTLSLSEEMLNSLRNLYEQNTKVPIPFLLYGEKDLKHTSLEIEREGYHRAYTATLIGKETIPVFIQFRENDSDIPAEIKKAILHKRLETEAYKIGFETAKNATHIYDTVAFTNVSFKNFLIENKASVLSIPEGADEKARDDMMDLDILLTQVYNYGVEHFMIIKKNEQNKKKITELGFKKTWGDEGGFNTYAFFKGDNELDPENMGKAFISIRENSSIIKDEEVNAPSDTKKTRKQR